MSEEDKKVERVSLDLETVGKNPGCGVLTIGACTLDRKHKFYQRIDPANCRLEGLIEEIDTMRWWSSQNREIREEAFGGTRTLVAVLDDFHDWMRSLNDGDWKNIEVWGNGSDFDNVILAAAYRKVDRPLPWGDYQNRCYRTLKTLLPHVKLVRATQKHHALLDAEYEAEHASMLLQVL